MLLKLYSDNFFGLFWLENVTTEFTVLLRTHIRQEMGLSAPLRAEPALGLTSNLGEHSFYMRNCQLHPGVKPSQLEKGKTNLNCSPLVSGKFTLVFRTLLAGTELVTFNKLKCVANIREWRRVTRNGQSPLSNEFSQLYHQIQLTTISQGSRFQIRRECAVEVSLDGTSPQTWRCVAEAGEDNRVYFLPTASIAL